MKESWDCWTCWDITGTLKGVYWEFTGFYWEFSGSLLGAHWELTGSANKGSSLGPGLGVKGVYWESKGTLLGTKGSLLGNLQASCWAVKHKKKIPNWGVKCNLQAS